MGAISGAEEEGATFAADAEEGEETSAGAEEVSRPEVGEALTEAVGAAAGETSEEAGGAAEEVRFNFTYLIIYTIPLSFIMDTLVCSGLSHLAHLVKSTNCALSTLI